MGVEKLAPMADHPLVGGVADVFRTPQHPYTRGLLASMPGGAPGTRLRAIDGTVPIERK